jgi:hypothetical protein
MRYTYDRADQFLPTDFPQFPRRFVSTNQFLTAEYRRVFSAHALGTFRFGYSRTRIGQEVEADYTFSGLEAFLRNRPQRFIGLAPEGDLERRWPFTLLGACFQDDLRLSRDLTLNAGLRYEFATLPENTEGRDVNLRDLSASEVTWS